MSLKTDIFVKDLDLTQDIRDYIDKKVFRLDRFLNQIDETRIDLAFVKNAREPNNRFVAQITLRGRGFILRAEERSSDIRSAIDRVLEKIERQIERYKGKKFKTKSGAVPASELLQEDKEEQQTPLIIRRKKFRLSPMDELEAIEQMNLLGHEDFFIYFNADTNVVNVLYKRRDGSYGLIEPELG
ncbi:MAG: ribosome-associated translation inhibitor RaiA [Pelolinea sp.]|nr:ribosome-associated translation inhibitor RaiA [Pelolinea sp.]